MQQLRRGAEKGIGTSGQCLKQLIRTWERELSWDKGETGDMAGLVETLGPKVVMV